MAVGLYITAAYWFTSSTSFANPAVTIARALSNTFAGIAPADVAAFVGMQLLAAVLATWFFRWLLMEDAACRLAAKSGRSDPDAPRRKSPDHPSNG
jgi:glycerol uptake facilitator-like aquaporin